MLSQVVCWRDIDPVQWANLWRLAYDPGAQPRRVYGLLDGGRPVALWHSEVGQVELARWPPTDDLHAAARELRIGLDADQAILVEVDVLEEVWAQQQRAYRPELPFDTYVLDGLERVERELARRAVRDPDAEVPPGFRHVHHREAIELLAPLADGGGSFLVAVFDHDQLWWSLAGRVENGEIDVLTTSLGVMPAGSELRGGWRESHHRLAEACGAALAPIRLAASMTLRAFEQVAFSPEPREALTAQARAGNALLDPWPHPG